MPFAVADMLHLGRVDRREACPYMVACIHNIRRACQYLNRGDNRPHWVRDAPPFKDGEGHRLGNRTAVVCMGGGGVGDDIIQMKNTSLRSSFSFGSLSKKDRGDPGFFTIFQEA
jgi:hypothetical protein